MGYRTLSSILLFPLLASPLQAGDPAPATATESERSITLANGIVSLTFAKRGGQGTSISFHRNGRTSELASGRSILYFDVGGGKVYPLAAADGKIVQRGPDAVEAVWKGEVKEGFPFETEVHCLLPRGESGFYLYAIYKRGPGMGASSIGETRFVIKGLPGTQLFTHHVVDDKRKGAYPTAKVVSQVQDATSLLEDGTIYTKYDNSAYLADHRVHGMAGASLGMWMIFPSNEFVGGGPFKQELTVNKENTLLGMLVGGHFGSGGLRFRADEPWTKVYGPLFVYLNEGTGVDALWEDAKKRADAEVEKWPYRWLKSDAYPLERSAVRGSLRFADGKPAKNAWVLLSPPGEDWTQVSKGYDFWTRTDEQGQFAMTKVRPGKYELRGIGADQFEEFKRENVEVAVGDNDLGELRWKPIEHGRKLWQIGVADRSSQEFKGGDNSRHYDNFARYAKDFPEDVTFKIGTSKESEDWNFAQWSIYSKKPHWTIQFDSDRALAGTATLTLGFTSANPVRGGRTNLQVKVNGKEVEVVHLPKTGTAGYRSGNSDSPYNVVYARFDAALLKRGANEIALGHAEAQAASEWKRGVPGQVMYDAIRLEVDPDAILPKRPDEPGPR